MENECTYHEMLEMQAYLHWKGEQEEKARKEAENKSKRKGKK